MAYLLLYPDQTGRLTLQVKAGILSRYRHVKVILSHAGGYVPYAADRIALLTAEKQGNPTGGASQDIRKFFFDTALSGERSPGTLRCNKAVDWTLKPRRLVQQVRLHVSASRHALHVVGTPQETNTRCPALWPSPTATA